jgi:hypothetical protein
MQKALRLPGTDAYSVYAYGMGLLHGGKNAKVLEIFTLNKQQHPDEKILDLPWAGARLHRNRRQEKCDHKLGDGFAKCTLKSQQPNARV